MFEPRTHAPAVVIAMSLVSLLACNDEKKKEPEKLEAPKVQPGGVDRALAAGTSVQVQAGKDAMVAQQCALRCQANPGIDPSSCLSRCIKTCGAEKDTAGIDGCAVKIAEQSPKL